MILDAPGHVEFLKNMVTGAAKADAALLVIDANEGVRENSKRHGVLLSLLGVRQIVVLINKMDLVGYNEAEFERLKTEYAAFVGRFGIEPIRFIPVAAFDGENLSRRSERMAWYQGPTVLEAIDAFEAARASEKLPLRLPVQDVYKFAADGDSRRIVAGTVESGAISVGDRLVFLPSGKRTTVRSLEAFQAERPARAAAGEATGFCMDEQIYVRRGEIACKEGEALASVASRISARIFWLGRAPMRAGNRYTLKLGTSRCQARLATIEQVIDTDSLAERAVDQVDCRQVADCVFELDDVIAAETAAAHPTLGRFVLLDGLDLSGGGTIREILDDRRLKVNLVKPAVIWFTGLPGSGKSTLAGHLVAKLRARGLAVEHLDGDETRQVLNERGFSHEERNRHIRNMAFVASRLEAHGVIVLASFVSPYRESREFARGICSRFFEIHLSTPVEECERRDPKGLYAKARRGEITHMTGFDDPYEAPMKPELTLDTSVLSVEECLARILAFGELEHV
jgi:bifunctional enzyme CysN/CysC